MLGNSHPAAPPSPHFVNRWRLRKDRGNFMADLRANPPRVPKTVFRDGNVSDDELTLYKWTERALAVKEAYTPKPLEKPVAVKSEPGDYASTKTHWVPCSRCRVHVSTHPLCWTPGHQQLVGMAYPQPASRADWPPPTPYCSPCWTAIQTELTSLALTNDKARGKKTKPTQLLASAIATAKATKKAAAKRAAAKRAAAKKAALEEEEATEDEEPGEEATKKVATKKVATKRAAPKRAAAKRAAAKKAAAKKAALEEEEATEDSESGEEATEEKVAAKKAAVEEEEEGLGEKAAVEGEDEEESGEKAAVGENADSPFTPGSIDSETCTPARKRHPSAIEPPPAKCARRIVGEYSIDDIVKAKFDGRYYDGDVLAIYPSRQEAKIYFHTDGESVVVPIKNLKPQPRHVRILAR